MRLCRTIMCNLAQLIKNLRRTTNPSEKRGPTGIYTKRVITDNTEKDRGQDLSKMKKNK